MGHLAAMPAGRSSDLWRPGHRVLAGAALIVAAIAVLALTRGTVTSGDTARRAQIQTEAQSAITAVMDARSDFGGVMFDETNGWYRLHIFYVGDNQGRARVERVLPADVPVEWTRVNHSYAELDAVQNAIVSLNNNRIAAGLTPSVSSTGIDFAANKVKVALWPDDTDFRQALSASYGEMVYFVVEPPGRPL